MARKFRFGIQTSKGASGEDWIAKAKKMLERGKSEEGKAAVYPAPLSTRPPEQPELPRTPRPAPPAPTPTPSRPRA